MLAAFVSNMGVAVAEPSLRVVLEYSAEPSLGCPSAGELRAGVVSQLGYDPFTSDVSEPRLRVAIAKLTDGTEAQIEWVDRAQQSEGERRLTSSDSDCAELARSLPFALAVQIQLHTSERPQPAPVAPVPNRVRPTERKRHVVAEPPKARRAVLVGAGALLRHGMNPGFNPGLRVFGVLSREPWSLELSGHATLPTELRRADGSGFSARELGANLAPCARWFPFGFCVVGSLSVLHVRGQGVERVASPSSTTGGVGARLQLLWPTLERFGVVLQLEALAVLGPRDVLLNQEVAWSTAPMAFTAILDFAAIFR
jgi:hypothetical protein